MKKFKLTEETEQLGELTLHRIQALQDFANVKAGDMGGWIENEGNLSHSGEAWVYSDARVEKTKDYLCVGPVGSRNGYTTMYLATNGGVGVKCGCFSGTLDEFEVTVDRVHGCDEFGREYKALIALARAKWSDKDE